MRKQASTPAVLIVIAAVVSVLSFPRLGAALPECPTDGITRTTSGSCATGTTCNDAYSLLWNQELPKINCPFGSDLDTLVSSNCSWNGSAYQVTGWIQYQCMTDCRSLQ
jgi:hypothetical protein